MEAAVQRRETPRFGFPAVSQTPPPRRLAVGRVRPRRVRTARQRERYRRRAIQRRKRWGKWSFLCILILVWGITAYGFITGEAADIFSFPDGSYIMDRPAVPDAAIMNADTAVPDAAISGVLTNPPAASGIRTVQPDAAEPPEPETAANITDMKNTENMEHMENADSEPENLIELPWNLIVISEFSPMPEDYPEPDLTSLPNGHAVDSRIYPDLSRMLEDARAAGFQPLICSSYRSRDKQIRLFSNKIQTYLNQGWSWEDANYHAALWVARPGASEHEAGLALDIVDRRYQSLDEEQANTPVQRWLMEHCAEYGFILRYPADKTDCTGVSYEPWHYRYVGAEAARSMAEQGLCLEEYVWRLLHEGA